MDDDGNNTICTYFENCYSCGVVYGSRRIGGFAGVVLEGAAVFKNCYSTASVGLDYTSDDVGGFVGATSSSISCLVKIGMEDTNNDGLADTEIYNTDNGNKDGTVTSGCVYINCYAAGETGGSLTDVEVIPDGYDSSIYITGSDEIDVSNETMIGGFIGKDGFYCTGSSDVYNDDGFDILKSTYQCYGCYVNCYYDKQTTAMNERACGSPYMYYDIGDEEHASQIPGVTGVYSLGSLAKEVQGLATTSSDENTDESFNVNVDMTCCEYTLDSGETITLYTGLDTNSGWTWNGSTYENNDSGDWYYSDGYYPQLFTLSDANTVDELFGVGSACYGSSVDTTNTSGASLTATATATADTADTDTDTDTESDSGTDTESDTDTDTSTGSDTESDTDTDTGTSAKSKSAGNVSGGSLTSTSSEIKAQIDEQLQQKAYTVLNLSAASVSTVLLEHWDQVMNMETGSLAGENDWIAGLSANKLSAVYEEDGETYYEDENGCLHYLISYTDLAAGSYDFKLQQGDSWAYNFGSDGFNGSNCTLEVAQDGTDVVIEFILDPTNLVSDSTNTTYSITAYFYTTSEVPSDTSTSSLESTCDSSTVLGSHSAIDYGTWYVAGANADSEGLSAWSECDENYKMEHISGTDEFQLALTLDADTYYFKITNGTWNLSYGAGGESNNGDNMTFTVDTDGTDVVITFNYLTHLCTVTATSGSVSSVSVDEEEIVFTGYSLIAHQTITGYDWLESQAAAEDGEMLYDGTTGLYVSKTYTIPATSTATAYGYKVIEDGNNTGSNSYFCVLSSTDTDCDVYFTYDESTGESTAVLSGYTSSSTGTESDTGVDYVIYSNDDGVELGNSLEGVITFYTVFGVEGLTGFNWQEENDEGENPADELVMTPADGVYTITFEDVPAAEDYQFKVVGNGTWDSGVEYGANDGSGNYYFTTTEASDVTITFNPTTQLVSVSTEPASALEVTEYMVSGNTALMGTYFSTAKADGAMTYTETTGLWTKTVDGLTSGVNYAFKVIEVGEDDSSGNICFQIPENNSYDGEYYLSITYTPSNSTTVWYVYDENGNEVETTDAVIDYWTLAGDEGLTGANWLADYTDETATSEQNSLTYNSETGLYEITFANIPLTEDIVSYAFKIVANGTWESGISYGTSTGGNYTLNLSNSSNTSAASCDVTIYFNAETGTIAVTTSDGDFIDDPDPYEFTWYVCGVSSLVSGDAYNAPTTVYDTVRNITAAFTLSGSYNEYYNSSTVTHYADWEIDEEKNKVDRFADTVSFDLDYEVDGKSVTGTFDEPVLTLGTTVNSEGLKIYSVDYFVVGKQWLQVTTNVTGESNDDVTVGTREIRVLPTTYLEAGNDATIYVYQSESDVLKENIKEYVSYSTNTKNDLNDNYDASNTPDSELEDGVTYYTGEQSVTYSVDSGNEDSVTDTSFSYYNFALTAGYLITDVFAEGYYGLYKNQGIQKYDADEIRSEYIYDENGDSSRTTITNFDSYFAMSAVYAENSSYTDNGNYIFNNSNSTVEGDTNLSGIDTVVDQALIGNSNTTAASSETAQTVVKVYKLNSDGSYSKVFMDADSSTSSYYENYLKWTGQQAFDSADEGTYQLQFYWSLSDGRYVYDTKTVTIEANLTNLEKSVSTNVSELNATDNDSYISDEITYSLTYTSNAEGGFEIYDILPYSGDTRLDEINYDAADGTTSTDVDNSVINNTNAVFILYGVTTNYSTSGTDPGISVYYTTNTIELNSTGDDFADDYVASGITWYNLSTADLTNGINITALKVVGTADDSNLEVDISFTVRCANASASDYYANNALFTSGINNTGNTPDTQVSGVSNYVSTAVVSRTISGYAWLDANRNGTYQTATEPPIVGIVATLYVYDSDSGTYVELDSTVTDVYGYYEFDYVVPVTNQLESSSGYKVYFSAPTDTYGKEAAVTIKWSAVDSSQSDKAVYYSDLSLSKTYTEILTQSLNGSRNIASTQADASGTSYYISENLPTAAHIRTYNGSSYLKAYITNYVYNKMYQNIGLTDLSGGGSQYASLTVHKLNYSGDAIEGVVFSLQAQSEDGESYSNLNFTVSYEYDTAGISEFADGVTYYIFDGTDYTVNTGDFDGNTTYYTRRTVYTDADTATNETGTQLVTASSIYIEN